jgi:hypothetical protein
MQRPHEDLIKSSKRNLEAVVTKILWMAQEL